MGIFYFSVFPLLIKNEKTENWHLVRWIFYFSIFGKKWKNHSSVYFLLRFHILTNWIDVIDLVKYTVLILNVHTNDLLKYLAFNRLGINFLFFRFWLKTEKSKNRKCPQAYSIFVFFRLLGKTEKWKIDKNILVSHKEDFSNFLIYRKIRKMEKWCVSTDPFLI